MTEWIYDKAARKCKICGKLCYGVHSCMECKIKNKSYSPSPSRRINAKRKYLEQKNGKSKV